MRKKYPIQLVPRTYTSTDLTENVADGQPREVLADRKAVRQSEFYQAVANGFRPEITFIVWRADYLDEDRLTYNGQSYEVIRRFPDPNDIEIELVCQLVDDANSNLQTLRDGF
jgi:SPP1 family predicted phage head-tail adaptor